MPSPGPDGTLTLEAEHADLHGDELTIETRGSHTNIGYWDNPSESASWIVNFPAPRRYKVSIETTTIYADTALQLEVTGSTIEGIVSETGS